MNVTFSIVNPLGGPANVDLYLGAQGPGGPPSLVAAPTAATLPTGLKAFGIPWFSYTFNGSEAAGSYVLFTLMAPHGADPSIPANQMSLDAAPFVKP